MITQDRCITPTKELAHARLELNRVALEEAALTRALATKRTALESEEVVDRLLSLDERRQLLQRRMDRLRNRRRMR